MVLNYPITQLHYPKKKCRASAPTKFLPSAHEGLHKLDSRKERPHLAHAISGCVTCKLCLEPCDVVQPTALFTTT